MLHSAAAVRKRAVLCAEVARSGRKAEEKRSITFILLFTLLALLFEYVEGCTNIKPSGKWYYKTVWMSVSNIILIMHESSLTPTKSLSLLAGS